MWISSIRRRRRGARQARSARCSRRSRCRCEQKYESECGLNRFGEEDQGQDKHARHAVQEEAEVGGKTYEQKYESECGLVGFREEDQGRDKHVRHAV